jgi:hypothetical protein
MHLDADALAALRRALYGSYRLDIASYRLDIAEKVHLVSRALPDGCVAAASVVDEELWLFVDPEKPYAMGHLRALLSEHRLDLPDLSDALLETGSKW